MALEDMRFFCEEYDKFDGDGLKWENMIIANPPFWHPLKGYKHPNHLDIEEECFSLLFRERDDVGDGVVYRLKRIY